MRISEYYRGNIGVKNLSVERRGKINARKGLILKLEN